jgi:hypothetical protein
MSAFNNPQHTWNQRFAAEHYVFGESPNAYLQSQAIHLVHGTALAVADGEGRNGVWLAEQGLQVDAFDFSDIGIQKAQALAQKRQVKSIVCAAIGNRLTGNLHITTTWWVSFSSSLRPKNAPHCLRGCWTASSPAAP